MRRYPTKALHCRMAATATAEACILLAMSSASAERLDCRQYALPPLPVMHDSCMHPSERSIMACAEMRRLFACHETALLLSDTLRSGRQAIARCQSASSSAISVACRAFLTIMRWWAWPSQNPAGGQFGNPPRPSGTSRWAMPGPAPWELPWEGA